MELLYAHKRVLVLGLGMSGRAAAKLLLKQGATVHGVDRSQELIDHHDDILNLKKEGMTVLLDQGMGSITHYDMVVVSPGVPSHHPLIAEAHQAGIEIIGEIELGCRLVKNPVLGITGTNGKTTVTLLVTHVLNACGIPAKALGNVGVPFSQKLLELDSTTIVVLELSSYQLETLSQPVLDGAVILNVTPDHLDRYPNMEAYAAAKFKIEESLKPGCRLFVEYKAMQEYGKLLTKVEADVYGYSKEHHLYTDLHSIFHEEKPLFELPPTLKGRPNHDIENLMAAYLLCAEKGITATQFSDAVKTFKKPAHRIEFVATKQGIHYYDDSKGTNIDAVIRAVESLNGPIVLIAGGVDKGSAYTPWIDAFKGKVRSICAIGQAAKKIKEQLSHAIPVKILNSLEDAVKESAAQAIQGDTVLLSPGCSSFDMFRDYAHRGEEFQKFVKHL